VRWLADENFRNAIIRGILRRVRSFDIVRAQDIPRISGQDDAELLKWATAEGRVVVTHDISTMIPAMREQLRLAMRCAPIVLVPDSLPIVVAVEDLLLLEECGHETDWAAGVLYLPLR
jgi:hypothetical protein